MSPKAAGTKNPPLRPRANLSIRIYMNVVAKPTDAVEHAISIIEAAKIYLLLAVSAIAPEKNPASTSGKEVASPAAKA